MVGEGVEGGVVGVLQGGGEGEVGTLVVCGVGRGGHVRGKG